MADNFTISGFTFASNEIGGVHYPKNKGAWGPAGTANDIDVAAGKRLPVAASLRGTSLVHGTVDVTTTGTALPDQACSRVRLTADEENQTEIYVGATGLTASGSTRGERLLPGFPAIVLEVSNLNIIFKIAKSGTQKLCYVCEP